MHRYDNWLNYKKYECKVTKINVPQISLYTNVGSDEEDIYKINIYLIFVLYY